MRRWMFGAALLFVSGATSCAFLLDTDELKEGTGEQVDAGTDGPDVDPIPLEDLPAALAGATCGVVQRCTGAAFQVFFLEEDCTTVNTRAFEDALSGLVQGSVDAGRLSYAPELAAQCVQAFETLPCPDLDRWPDICYQAIQGLVPDGGECGHNLDCERGTFCDTTGGICPGVCSPERLVGEECLLDGSNEDDMCEDGLECHDGVCMEQPTVGQSCGDATPDCELGRLCLGSTCISVEDLFRSLEGQSCNFKVGPLCESDLHCAVKTEDTGLCERTALAGGPCSLAIPDQCPEGEYCSATPANPSGGVCTGLPGANQPCRVDPYGLNPPCQPYHRCLGGVCLPLRRIGEACVANGQCYSAWCEHETKTCQTLGCAF